MRGFAGLISFRIIAKGSVLKFEEELLLINKGDYSDN